MPPVSEAQRRLMHAAAHTKGGIGGVSQSVGKEFSAADKPGKLPARKKPASERLYGKKGYADGGPVETAPGSSWFQKAIGADALARGFAKKVEDADGGKAPDKSDDKSSSKPKGFADGGAVKDDMPAYVKAGDEKEAKDAANAKKGVDVDQEADAVRKSKGDWEARLGRRLQNSSDADRNMDTQARAPGTRDTAQYSGKTSEEFSMSDLVDGKEMARGGKITEVAGKPIGKDDGLIAAQRGEFVVKKSAVKKLGMAVMNEINKGRLPSERLYGSRKAVRHAG